MATKALVDSLDAALTDMERFAQVLETIRASDYRYEEAVCSLINNESHRIAEERLGTFLNATMVNFKRMGDLYVQLSRSGECYPDVHILSEQAFGIVTKLSPACTESEAEGNAYELKELNYWMAVKSTVETSWPGSPFILTDVYRVMCESLGRLEPSIAGQDYDRPMLIEMLELSVKVRIDLASAQAAGLAWYDPEYMDFDDLVAGTTYHLENTEHVLDVLTDTWETCHDDFEPASTGTNEQFLGSKSLHESQSVDLPQDASVLEDQIASLGGLSEKLDADLSAKERDDQAVGKAEDLFQNLMHRLEDETANLRRALADETQFSTMLSDFAEEKDKLADARKSLKSPDGLHESTDTALNELISLVKESFAGITCLQATFAELERGLEMVRDAREKTRAPGFLGSISMVQTDIRAINKIIKACIESSEDTHLEKLDPTGEIVRLNNDLETSQNEVMELTGILVYLEQELANMLSSQKGDSLPQEETCNSESQQEEICKSKWQSAGALHALDLFSARRKDLDKKLISLVASSSRLYTESKRVEKLTVNKDDQEDHCTHSQEPTLTWSGHLPETMHKSKVDEIHLDKEQEPADPEDTESHNWPNEHPATDPSKDAKHSPEWHSAKSQPQNAADARINELLQENSRLKEELAMKHATYTDTSSPCQDSAHNTTLSTIEPIDEDWNPDDDDSYSNFDSCDKETTPAACPVYPLKSSLGDTSW